MIGERDRAEDIDGEALLSVLLLEGLLSGNRDDAARGPGPGPPARWRATSSPSSRPALDAYQRYLVAMARELEGSRRFVWPKIDCEGRQQTLKHEDTRTVTLAGHVQAE